MTTALGLARRGFRHCRAFWLGLGALVAWPGMSASSALGAEATTNAAPAKAAAPATNAPPTKVTGAATNTPPAKAAAPAKAGEAPAKPSAAKAPAAKAEEPESKDKEKSKDNEKEKETGKKEGEAPAELTPEQTYEGGAGTFKNWVEVTGGGMLVKGDAAQAEQRQMMKRGAFGGIEDLHVEGNMDKKTTVSLDGHGIFDDHNYQLRLNIKREDTGYLKLTFENSRTWSDISGGFFGPDSLHFSTFGQGLPLDWGKVAFETGYTPKDGPKITFNYTHRYRQGDDSSTIWGPVNTSAGTRDIYPSSYYIDEKSDAFELNVAHRISSVDVGGGASWPGP